MAALKEAGRAYLCSIVQGPIPRTEHMSLVVMGLRNYEVAFYSSLLVTKAREMADIAVTVIPRSYNLQQYKRIDVKTKVKHHFNSIVLMVFVTTVEEVLPLQISFGLGKKPEHLLYDTQVKLHYLDNRGTFPVHVAKIPEAHNGKKFDHRKFRPAGFVIDGITLAVYKHLVALLPRSVSWLNEWQNHPNLVALHTGPTLSSQANGEPTAKVFSLYFRFSSQYITSPMHALDPVIKASGIGERAPRYAPLATLSNGAPGFFNSPHLSLDPAQYPNEAVPEFKLTDEDKARKSYEENVPAGRRRDTTAATQVVLPPSDWMPTFLRW